MKVKVDVALNIKNIKAIGYVHDIVSASKIEIKGQHTYL